MLYQELSTDGIAIYKSSNYSVWPIFLVFLNLPREMRFKVENLFLSSLYTGTKDPKDMNILFMLVVEELQTLYEGIP